MKRPQPDMRRRQDSLLGKRIAAWFIDSVLIAVFSLILIGGLVATVLSSSSGTNNELIGSQIVLIVVLGSVVSAVIQFLYPIIMEAKYGQTFGKKAMGIVVVKEDGSPCDWKASILRNILRIVDQQFLYMVGIVLIYATDKHQRLGDIVGETIVTKTGSQQETQQAGMNQGMQQSGPGPRR